MLRHIVLLTLSEDAGPDELAAIKEGTTGLISVIPEIQAYSVEFDIGISPGNSTLAIVGDFADAEAYKTYAEHPVHLQVIAEKIKPYVVGRSAVQVNVS